MLEQAASGGQGGKDRHKGGEDEPQGAEVGKIVSTDVYVFLVLILVPYQNDRLILVTHPIRLPNSLREIHVFANVARQPYLIFS